VLQQKCISAILLSLSPSSILLTSSANLSGVPDSLEIAGFDIAILEGQLFERNTISHVAMPSRRVAGSMTKMIHHHIPGVNVM
jgi:hypothetical protein